MRKGIALGALVLALAPIGARAHGPGGNGQPWNNLPTKDYFHAHCSTAYSANEFYVRVPQTGTSVGFGKHTQNPTATDDIYLILPAPVPTSSQVRNTPAAPQNVGGCFDSTLP